MVVCGYNARSACHNLSGACSRARATTSESGEFPDTFTAAAAAAALHVRMCCVYIYAASDGDRATTSFDVYSYMCVCALICARRVRFIESIERGGSSSSSTERVYIVSCCERLRIFLSFASIILSLSLFLSLLLFSLWYMLFNDVVTELLFRRGFFFLIKEVAVHMYIYIGRYYTLHTHTDRRGNEKISVS